MGQRVTLTIAQFRKSNILNQPVCHQWVNGLRKMTHIYMIKYYSTSSSTKRVVFREVEGNGDHQVKGNKLVFICVLLL